VINCLKAENRTMEPSFRAYRKHTAETLAVKNNIDIADVKDKLEIYDASTEGRSMH